MAAARPCIMNTVNVMRALSAKREIDLSSAPTHLTNPIFDHHEIRCPNTNFELGESECGLDSARAGAQIC
jgi:hypothetical protein